MTLRIKSFGKKSKLFFIKAMNVYSFGEIQPILHALKKMDIVLALHNKLAPCFRAWRQTLIVPGLLSLILQELEEMNS